MSAYRSNPSAAPAPRRLAALCATVLLCAASLCQAATLQGRVFDDRNGNGQLDPGEPGVADVRVSDGLNIVTSGDDGAYRLDVADEAVVFIVKPRGYRTPVNDDQIPQFFYIHQPRGTPFETRYPAIEPTGPLPERLDFPLQAQDEPVVFEALLFSDTQPQTEAEVDYIRDTVVAENIGTDARFGMTMGDIMFDDLSLFPRYNAVIAQLGIPWYNVPGNHELNFEAPDDRHSLETFKRYFGPPYYSFEFGDALFVVLDNMEYRGNGQSDPGDVRGNGGYVAKFGRRQLAWLKKELSYVPQDRLVFLAMHSPLVNDLGDSPTSTTQDRRELYELLEGRPNLYSVAGHTHTTEHHYLDGDDGFAGPGAFHHHVLSVVSGSWWSGPFDPAGIPTSDQRDGTPRGYHVLEVDGAAATVRYKAAGRPADYQMRILYDVAHHGLEGNGMRDFRAGELFDGRFEAAQVPAAEVLVNLFDGGPRSTVEFRVDDGPYEPMARVRRPDPYMIEVFTRHADTKKSWLEATPSSHIWRADVPDDLGVGTYTLSVRATDEFGRVHHAHSILEVGR